ncbi:MAG: protein kinase domain-containing protein [Gemmatimonadales bacterium]
MSAPPSFVDALRDRYAIERELGRGGMATVYLAHELKHDRAVAFKVLHAELGVALGPERFLREISLTARLQHPHILPLFDSGETAGRLWYTMPYVEGESLRDRLRREIQLPVDEAVRLAAEVADALDYAHRHGVVHRDIKPENILLEETHALVADFGVARAVDVAGEGKLTETGLALGTPAYMSPEQASAGAVDARSDIYALGCVLYEMLAGEPPFTGPTPQAIIAKRFSEAVPSIHRLRDTVPPALERAVSRALSRVPADRFGSAAQFGQALAAVEAEPTVPATRVTDRRRRPRRRLIAAVATAAVAVAAVVAVLRDPLLGRNDRSPITSVAVLPLANLSGNPEQEYLADGMTDALIARLARIRALRVMSRTSVMQYKGARTPLPEIARALRVDAVIEGSVQSAGDQVRVTAQLIDARTERHLWVDTYEEELSDVLRLESRIAQSIADEIRIAVTPGERTQLARSAPVNPEVYQLYLRGRYFWNKRDEEGVKKSLDYFRQALERDSTYAPAWAGIADAYLTLYDYEYLPAAEAAAKARAAAERARALDESLAAAHNSLAHLSLHDWQWAAAERGFRRAIDLDPSYVPAHHWYALCLTAVGRVEEAVAAIRRAQELDPLSIRINADVGMALHAAGRYDEAIEQERRTIELDSTSRVARWIQGMAYEQKGMLEEAKRSYSAALARSPGNPNFLASLAHAHAVAGERAAARAILDTLERQAGRGEASPFFLALVHAGLGETDLAFRWLERAYVERSGSVRYLKVERRLDPLRSDPRFAGLLKKVNLD